MTILLLGGITESRRLAEALIARRFDVIYSIAGLVRKPQLDCEVRVGGFSAGGRDGVEGMSRFIEERGIDRIVDATHPYAARISAHAMRAAGLAGIEYWRYERPGWHDEIRDALSFEGWDDLMRGLRGSRRPFFTLGRSVLDNLHRRLPDQHWVVRTAMAAAPVDHATVVRGIGPFDYDHEHALMREHRVDALITKNSGGAGSDKLRAARDLGIPVLVQRRPAAPAAERCFDRVEDLLDALGGPRQDSVETRAGKGA